MISLHSLELLCIKPQLQVIIKELVKKTSEWENNISVKASNQKQYKE